jgi:hypothetical protein
MDEYRRDLVLAYLCRFRCPDGWDGPARILLREGSASPPSVPQYSNVAATHLHPLVGGSRHTVGGGGGDAPTGGRAGRQRNRMTTGWRERASSCCWAAFRIFQLGLTLAKFLGWAEILTPRRPSFVHQSLWARGLLVSPWPQSSWVCVGPLLSPRPIIIFLRFKPKLIFHIIYLLKGLVSKKIKRIPPSS